MHSVIARALAALRRDPWFVAVVAVGLLARTILIPITHGQDFLVWDRASAASLHGINIYAHHPRYPGGPYAYFPLFLYIELPFRWLAQHSALTFTVLGKLPILAADVTCAVLIRDTARYRGGSRRMATTAAALFFLNPLVLYNSAYYGRFDTVACALLLLAYRGFARESVASYRTVTFYALAVAAKTFPGFAIAGVLRHARGARTRVLAVLGLVLVAISLPYAATPWPLIRDIVLYDAAKAPGGLSWQRLLSSPANSAIVHTIGIGLLVLFVLCTIWFSRLDDLRLYFAVTFVVFLLCAKVVLEQYLIWALPWLVLLAGSRTRIARASLTLLGIFSVVGMLSNESFHPFGRGSLPLSLILTAACAGYVVLAALESSSSGRTPVHADKAPH